MSKNLKSDALYKEQARELKKAGLLDHVPRKLTSAEKRLITREHNKYIDYLNKPFLRDKVKSSHKLAGAIGYKNGYSFFANVKKAKVLKNGDVVLTQANGQLDRIIFSVKKGNIIDKLESLDIKVGKEEVLTVFDGQYYWHQKFKSIYKLAKYVQETLDKHPRLRKVKPQFSVLRANQQWQATVYNKEKYQQLKQEKTEKELNEKRRKEREKKQRQRAAKKNSGN